MTEPHEYFYQGGGSLPANIPSYVEREADKLLYNYLKDGHFCYVLSARQMGKSSLRVRVMNRLIPEGYLCCALDISKIGKELSGPDEWYYTLIDTISDDLKLNINLGDWWEKEKMITPVYRFFKFIKEILLQQTTQKIIIFFDEIDSMLSLNKKQVNTDDFFAAIRSIYNERADNPIFNRLNFVIIGVASPNELMNDSTRTPFNIGRSIPLNNISREEANVLEDGLKNLPFQSSNLMNEIFVWSNGQPFLTQKICESISAEKQPGTDEKALVKKHVDLLFLNPPLSNSNNINLLNIQNRIENNKLFGVEMLSYYTTILKKESVKEDTANLAQIYLRLTGIVRRDSGMLHVNNNIYKSKLNLVWAADLYSRISKPFKSAIDLWVENDKTADKALRGEVLDKYAEWCNKQNKLTPIENEFLNFSFQTKNLEELNEKILKSEREKMDAERKLSEEKRKQLEEEKLLAFATAEKAEKETNAAKEKAIASEKKRKNIFIAFALMAGVLAVLAIYYYTTLRGKIKDAEKANLDKIKIEKQVDSIKREIDSTKSKQIKDSILNHSNMVADSIRNAKERQSQKKSLQLLAKQNSTLAKQNNEVQKRLNSESLNLAKLQTQFNDERVRYEREIAESKKTKQQLDAEYNILNENRWLYLFDSTDRQQIVTKAVNEKDSLAREKILDGYQQLSNARTLASSDPNKAFWMIMEEWKKKSTDSIIAKQAKYVAENSLFYSERRSILPSYSDSSGDEIEFIEPVEKSLHLALINHSYALVDAEKDMVKTLSSQSEEFPELHYISRMNNKIVFINNQNQLMIYDFNGRQILKKALPASNQYLRNANAIYYGGDNTLYLKQDMTYTRSGIRNYNIVKMDIDDLQFRQVNIQKAEKVFKSKLSSKDTSDYRQMLNIVLIEYNEQEDAFIICFKDRQNSFGLYKYDANDKVTPLGANLSQSTYRQHEITITPNADAILLTPPYGANLPNSQELVMIPLNGNPKKINLPEKTYFNFHSHDNNYFLLQAAESDNILFLNNSNGKVKTFINDLTNVDYAEINSGKLFTYSNNVITVWNFEEMNTAPSYTIIEQKYIDRFRKDFEGGQPSQINRPVVPKQIKLKKS